MESEVQVQSIAVLSETDKQLRLTTNTAKVFSSVRSKSQAQASTTFRLNTQDATLPPLVIKNPSQVPPTPPQRFIPSMSQLILGRKDQGQLKEITNTTPTTRNQSKNTPCRDNIII